MSLLQELRSDNQRMLTRLGITPEQENAVLGASGVQLNEILYNRDKYHWFKKRVLAEGHLDRSIDFWCNPEIDMSIINDSMELDSNQVIATLEVDDILLSLEVRGETRVEYKGVIYYTPSEFPKELKTLIHASSWWMNHEDVQVYFNNWFEVFDEGQHWSDVVDAEQLDEDGLKELLLDIYVERYVAPEEGRSEDYAFLYDVD